MPETKQFGSPDGSTQAEGPLKANQLLAERYRILGVIGSGGMGTVYKARDVRFDDANRQVAVKVIQTTNTEPSMRATTLRNFRRESNLLATLSHPAIPKIFDFFDEDDQAFLVMEFINGRDLEAIINKTRDLPVDKVLEWSIDLCDALQYLHNYQPEPIIFRDLKPSNIMIDSLGKVRLIDFGIAKVFVSGVKHTMIGTEGYSAPEQYRGDATPLSDIYGLGATLHHILTRRDPRLEPPFSFHERPIGEINPKVPPAFVSVIEKSISTKPEDRYQSCAEMKAALEAVRYRPSLAALPTNGSTEQSTSLFEDFDQTGGGNIQPRWVFETEDEIRSSPTAHKRFAFVGSYDTNMWGLNLEDGEFAWKYATQGGIASSPVIDAGSGLVLFGSEDNMFYAVDHRRGTIQWSFLTHGHVRGSANVVDGKVFFGSDDGNLYALVAANGRELWRYDMGSPVRTRPAITDEIIVVGSEQGDIAGLELSGTRKWAFRSKRGLHSSPYVDPVENICFIGGMDGFMYALDALSGYKLWRYRTNGPIVASPIVDDGVVYFGSADGNFYALNAETSKEKWRFTIEKPIVAPAVVHQGAVYFGGTDGVFYSIDIASGKERWHFQTGASLTAMPFIIDNIILIGSMDKKLYALPLVG